MKIYIDADACPVTRIVENLASKYSLPCTLLCDTNHVLYSDYSDVIIVGAGADAVDFEETQKRFLERLESGAFILDFGCGSGRDTKYFLERGYLVDAVDGSEELCRFASAYTGTAVRQMLFQELDESLSI